MHTITTRGHAALAVGLYASWKRNATCVHGYSYKQLGPIYKES